MDAFNGSVKRKNKRLSLKKTRATIPNGEEREITEDNDVNILPYNGLINTGNTCYANVIIQSLKYTPHFIETLNHTEISCLLMQEVFIIIICHVAITHVTCCSFVLLLLHKLTMDNQSIHQNSLLNSNAIILNLQLGSNTTV
jgi:uncharacterized UBP type Zn finger protein